MSVLRPRFGYLMTLFLLAISLVAGRALADNVYASIRGTVTDVTGAAVVGATVTATGTKTGIVTTVKTDNKGRYDFVQLAVGEYTVQVSQSGFKSEKTNAINLVVNQVYSLDVPLSAGGAQEVVEVQGSAVQVDTQDTQLKTLFTDQQIVDLPLISRNFTALEQLAPGVQASSDRFGSFSANGSQSNQSSYLINGQDSNDLPLNTVSIVPSPDAISEFNLITSTLNAEYGRNSGAIVNALIKSGTNQIHGSGFEFYRDTFLDSKNFFQFTSGKPVFHQNEYGGTIGGPIVRDKLFQFLSYQGFRSRNLNATENLTILNSQELAGNFSADAAITSTHVIPFAITGPSGPCGPGTASPQWNQCFASGAANQIISTNNFNAISKTLASSYIAGKVNSGSNGYIWNANTKQGYDQGITRTDYTITPKDTLWLMVFFQSSPSTDDVPFTGATVPGFGDSNSRHYKQFVTSFTHTFTSNVINEFRVGYTRFNYGAVQPQKVVQPSSVGFAINSQNTASAGLPYVSVGGAYTFALGFSTNGPQPRKDQTYQLNDNLTIVHGAHSYKLGIDARRFQVDNPFYGRNNGSYSFAAGGTFSSGNAGLDFLLGIPDSYGQASGGRIDAKAYETYSFVQDTFKVLPSLVLNYGIGYQLDTSLDNLQNKGLGVNCISLAGAQSKVFPTAPAGLLFPGDAGCSKSGYSSRYDHFGPRFGFDYSPSLGMISGGSQQKLAIRGGFGYYYNRAEEELSLQNLGAVPFAQSSSGAADTSVVVAGATIVGSPAFANPYADVANRTGLGEANKFPFTPPAAGAAVSFGQFYPLQLNSTNPNLTAPQSMNFNLNVQREFGSRMVAQAGYVGSLGRHLIRAYENNPITLPNVAVCAATPACVSGRISQHVQYPTHSVLPGNILASDGQQSSDGSSNYNSLQASIHKDPTHGFSFLAAYTYSHALDNASGYENSYARTTIPYAQYGYLNYGDSGYDARHRLVVSYTYELPIPSALHGFVRTALGSIKVSGITTVATGFPIDMTDSSTYTSLTCDQYAYYGCTENPNRTSSGKPQTLNPRSATGPSLGSYLGTTGAGATTKTNLFFQPTAFTHETGCGLVAGCVPLYGQYGNASRDFFHGPGINNTDAQISKVFLYRERYRVELRMEGYNVFNHTQFALPSGNANSTNFGRVTSASSGRTVQLAGKFYF